MAEKNLVTRVLRRITTRDLATRIMTGVQPDIVRRMLDRLDENGFSPITTSWREGGKMTALSHADLEVGIGSGLAFETTSQHGFLPDETMDMLAKQLPAIVRRFRASGEVEM